MPTFFINQNNLLRHYDGLNPASLVGSLHGRRIGQGSQPISEAVSKVPLIILVDQSSDGQFDHVRVRYKCWT